MDALLQQRFEDQVTAALECQNPELVRRHLQGLHDLVVAADHAADEVEAHLNNLTKRTVRLPLGID